jgi:hypothetical protein
VQNGPRNDCLEYSWELTISPFIEVLVDALPRAEAALLSVAAAWDAEEPFPKHEGRIEIASHLVRSMMAQALKSGPRSVASPSLRTRLPTTPFDERRRIAAVPSINKYHIEEPRLGMTRRGGIYRKCGTTFETELLVRSCASLRPRRSALRRPDSSRNALPVSCYLRKEAVPSACWHVSWDASWGAKW